MSLAERLKSAKAEADNLKKQIQEALKAKATDVLPAAAGDVAALPGSCPIKVRRTLKGHLNKIYDVHWAKGSTHLVSACQDGRLIVWDGMTTNKLNAIPLRSCWVMSCAFAPSGQFVASGGLDNIVSVYDLNDKPEGKDQLQRPKHELTGHNGYISGIRFLDDNRVLSSAGDRSAVLWDLSKDAKSNEFIEHAGDVVSLALGPTNDTFLTGSTDYTAKLWDLRTNKCQMTFVNHQGDVNSLEFFPNSNAFASGSEDNTIRLFDIRSLNEVAVYTHKDMNVPVTSIGFSSSGRCLFASYDADDVQVYDTLKCERRWKLSGHKGRVDCLNVNSDGTAVCTASWDQTLRIWA